MLDSSSVWSKSVNRRMIPEIIVEYFEKHKPPQRLFSQCFVDTMRHDVKIKSAFMTYCRRCHSYI